MKKPALVFLAVLCAATLQADVEFSGLDLADSDELLFTATLSAPPFGSYRTLLLAELEAQRMRQLTVFPERLTYLRETGELQYQNRFGVFRSNSELEAPLPIDGFPAFIHGRTTESGKTMPIEPSPDGRFLTYSEATSAAYGNLVLYDVRTRTRTVVVADIELSLAGPPVRWSPDSRVFIYRKSGELYYFSITHFLEDRQLGESLRRIGPGAISSVRWSAGGDLYYLSGSLVYRISPAEFFARTFYRDLLRTGSVVGKLPLAFDPSFDQFWMSPDSRSILLGKGGRNLFVYVLSAEDWSAEAGVLQLPYVLLPHGSRIDRVLWSSDDVITVLVSAIRDGLPERTAYRLTRVRGGQHRLERLSREEQPLRDVVLSPDGTRVAVLYDRSVVIRSHVSWRAQQSFAHRQPLHAVWPDDQTVVVAGRYLTERIALRTGSQRPVALSQPDRAGFSALAAEPGVAPHIVVDVAGRSFRYQRDEERFLPTPAIAIREHRTASSRYRVYLETHSAGSYRNIVMLRDIEGVQTSALFLPPQRDYDPFPLEDDPIDLTVFSHGSRIRAREAAFAINAIDSVEGLSTILATLAEYSIRTTFFVNGDFIRRHPDAVREIARSGHEVGSLFYTHFDMTDARYEINREFIKRGLARNEDKYYEATGRELSLIWHTPFYFVSPTVVAASRQMNYTYVGRDVDSLDWVPRRDDSGVSRLYYRSADIIERVIEQTRPGSIISITVGVPLEDQPWGGRDDYLFNDLDLLINRLSERGYRIVPVSELIERAR
ncbi:MAG: polysaccharide deacetylase family protein [Spirochaetaceae bacterium]|nr:MAG: polysaccharide deacetylase family protein [Spirochaetaceae bacterium]